MINEWERREKESPKAYEAFCVYKDLGRGRSLSEVSEKLRKSYALIRRWAKAYEWQKRADAWDNSISDKVIEKVSDSYAQMLELQINIGRMMQAKGTKAIQNMNFSEVTIKSLPAITALINSGVNLERTSRGLIEEKN